jgi:hypothetical protein
MTFRRPSRASLALSEGNATFLSRKSWARWFVVAVMGGLSAVAGCGEDDHAPLNRSFWFSTRWHLARDLVRR